ncbi:universal stress protein [Halomarina oriensis]|uniref:Universal stress protein n=1 Tax=Halomarina oriensis TaxID=671145 RepID=A0A6B0GIS3_9EURY|nr:universal stress protein [Halomarina oriensis]MWG33767.1 universal stress protein [Halomarina oriensis]
MMYNAILIPTNGSDHAECVAEPTTEIARANDATIHILHVVDSTPIERKLALTEVDVEEQSPPDNWVSRGDQITEQLALRVSDQHLDVVTEVRFGIPAREIRTFIDDHDIDLVSMGTRGTTGLQRYLLGSVSSTIIRSVDVPVLCLNLNTPETPRKHAKGEPFENVLVPVDGSKLSHAALDHAMAIVRAFDTTIHLLYVADSRAYSTKPGRTWSDIEETLEQAGRSELVRVASQAESADLKTVQALRHGIPHRRILEYIDEFDIDMVAMGTHGRSGINRALIGSTTSRVLRETSIPVLSVRKLT